MSFGASLLRSLGRLVIGIMDLRAMAVVAAAIAAECLAPPGEGIVRAAGCGLLQ